MTLKPFQEAALRFVNDDCPQMAAAISYYALFSIVPLLILLTSIAGILLQDRDLQSRVVDEVLKNIPFDKGEGRDAVTDAISGISQSSAAIGVLGLVGMLWSGSAVFGVVRKSLNTVYRDTQWRRPVVQQKLVDLAMVAAVGVFFLVSIGATTALRVARSHSEQLASWSSLADQAAVLWDIASFVAPLSLSFGAFLFVYALVPARRRGIRDVWPGALLAAVLFEIAKMSFSIYIEHFANYDVVYGSLGAVVALMFWIYVSSNIMLLGAELTVVFVQSGRTEPRSELTNVKTPWRVTATQFIRRLFVADPGDDAGNLENRKRLR